MARGNLPEQTPSVPEGLFFAFNDLYLYVRQLSADLAAAEATIEQLTNDMIALTTRVDDCGCP